MPARPRLQLLTLALGELDMDCNREGHTTILPNYQRINASGH
jgi:hypothetical protein